MTNEGRYTGSLRIKKDNLDHRSFPTSFLFDVAGSKGPTPGAITAAVAGTDVDLTELTTPAFCRISNLDTSNFVEYGIWDPEGSTFYPLGEVGPGEFYVIKLSRNLQEEYGTGTGTTGASTNRLRIKADTAACNVVVDAFEV